MSSVTLGFIHRVYLPVRWRCCAALLPASGGFCLVGGQAVVAETCGSGWVLSGPAAAAVARCLFPD